MGASEDLQRLKRKQSLRRRIRSRDNLCLDRPQTERLLAYLEQALKQHGCDHTFKFTIEWAFQHGVDARKLMVSTHAFEARCDCEVSRQIVPKEIF